MSRKTDKLGWRHMPSYKRGVRQLAAWHEECRVRRLAKAGDEKAKKYLKNRSMHIRCRGADGERTKLAREMA